MSKGAGTNNPSTGLPEYYDVGGEIVNAAEAWYTSNISDPLKDAYHDFEQYVGWAESGHDARIKDDVWTQQRTEKKRLDKDFGHESAARELASTNVGKIGQVSQKNIEQAADVYQDQRQKSGGMASTSTASSDWFKNIQAKWEDITQSNVSDFWNNWAISQSKLIDARRSEWDNYVASMDASLGDSGNSLTKGSYSGMDNKLDSIQRTYDNYRENA